MVSINATVALSSLEACLHHHCHHRWPHPGGSDCFDTSHQCQYIHTCLFTSDKGARGQQRCLNILFSPSKVPHLELIIRCSPLADILCSACILLNVYRRERRFEKKWRQRYTNICYRMYRIEWINTGPYIRASKTMIWSYKHRCA